jgi:nucleoid DNA-binding protein
MAVLEGLLTLIPREISQGNIVELGEFGTLWMRIQSEGSERVEEVNGNNVKRVLPRFSPGKEFKQVLSQTEFSKA